MSDTQRSIAHRLRRLFTAGGDLSHLGFKLDGGRREYLDRRTVAAIVYRRGGHVINAYVGLAKRGPAA